MSLGQVIAQRWKACHLSQETLAFRAGLSRGTLAQIERGLVRMPKADNLQRLAEVLGTSASCLLEEAGLKAPPATVEESLYRSASHYSRKWLTDVSDKRPIRRVVGFVSSSR